MNIREWTLPVYTILIQLASGSLLFLWTVRTIKKAKIDCEVLDNINRYPILVIFITIFAAMVGSHFHLSRPIFSIFAVLNFRTAWLSREIAFNILFFIACGILCLLIWFQPGGDRVKTTVGWIAIFLGLIFVFCSARIYLLRTHPAWNTPITIASFYLTMILLGAVALPLMMLLEQKFAEVRRMPNLDIRQQILRESLPWFAMIAAAAAVGIIVTNYLEINHLRRGGEAALTSLKLLLGLYGPLFSVRLLALITGTGLLSYTVYWKVCRKEQENKILVPFYISCVLIVLGEILGRILFYATHVRLGI